ncbi:MULTISPECIES: hypothetical protein [Sorangium]|uniref:hypothetical protein n=1 Tax=Sorangium TaxID=39643 RepID=UPI003D9C1E26
MRRRDKGLDQLTDAPSLPIAGTEAYPASAPWVLIEDGRLARLEEAAPAARGRHQPTTRVLAAR